MAANRQRGMTIQTTEYINLPVEIAVKLIFEYNQNSKDRFIYIRATYVQIIPYHITGVIFRLSICVPFLT